MTREVDPDQKLAEALRLHGDPPLVARLSRRTLILLAGVASVAVAGVAGWAMTSHPPERGRNAQPPPATPSAPPEQISELPGDYAASPASAPKLGPPLPGDLGRPLLAARPELRAEVAAGREGRAIAGDPEYAERVRASRLFSSESVSRTSGDAVSSSVPPPEAEVTRLVAPSLSEAGQEAPAGRRVLQAGSMIPAALITGVRSEQPGLVTAQVTSDVFDSVSGRWKLIPQGSRLIGAYEHQIAFGQTRVLLAWARLILPDGRSVDLDRAPAADPQGYAGIRDQIDRRWGQVLGASLISTVLGMGAEVGAGSGDSEIIRALRTGGANAASNIGQQIVGRTLDVQPGLTIRPGFPVRVMLAKDLTLEPWLAP